jgi:hypothetical protein
MRSGTAGAIRTTPAGTSGVSPGRLRTSSNGAAAAQACGVHDVGYGTGESNSARSKSQNSSGNRCPVCWAAPSSPTPIHWASTWYP